MAVGEEVPKDIKLVFNFEPHFKCFTGRAENKLPVVDLEAFFFVGVTFFSPFLDVSSVNRKGMSLYSKILWISLTL